MKTYCAPRRLPRWGSLARIISEVPSGSDVLDVGCSTGYLAQHLAGRNRVWGIDVNSDAVAAARRVCVDAARVDLNACSGQAVEIFGRRFDTIVFADVLEHLLRPERVLRFFVASLNPGGRVIVSLPNVALWRVRLWLLFGRFDYTEYGVLDDTHLHLYTFSSAKRLLESAGLRVPRVVGAADGLGPLVAAFPIFRTLLSINIVAVGIPRSPQLGSLVG